MRDEEPEEADDAERPERPPAAERLEARDDDDDVPSVDEVIGHFLEESALWPVLVVAVGSASAFGAAMIVLAVIDRNPFAAAALLLVFGMTVDVSFRAGRETGYRNLARLVWLIWLVAFALAALAVWTGIAFS